MNKLLNALKEVDNFTVTENGAVTHKSTLNKCYDLFAFGGALRNRDEQSILGMFYDALKEDEELAMKLLFYIRDVRGGLGERRTFRVILKKLATSHPYLVRANINLIPFYGRYDDLLVLLDTPCEKEALILIAETLSDDIKSEYPTLLAKWLPSENASSNKTKALARKLIKKMNFKPRTYRQMLSVLRKRIKIVETLLTEKKYDEIDFGKLPSRAGLKYKSAFYRHEELSERYKEFIDSKETKVHASTLYPYDVLRQARSCRDGERNAINKYWDNLTDYFDGQACSILPVVDTSGSMKWSGYNVMPIDVAVSLGIYCAERNKGDFHNHYISFSNEAHLVEIKGYDFVDKARRIIASNVCQSTNIESVFNLVLNTCLENNLEQEELPKQIVIISDMEFNRGVNGAIQYSDRRTTLMEGIRNKWREHGYEMPNLVYWNVNARNNNISDLGADNITYVSGCTPLIFKMVMSGKNGMDLMLDTVMYNERYSNVKVR